MRRCGERELSTRVFECFQQEWDARERLRCGEELCLQFGLLGGESGAGDRQLGPGMEDFRSLWILLACVGVWGKRVREERGIRRDQGGLAIGP